MEKEVQKSVFLLSIFSLDTRSFKKLFYLVLRASCFYGGILYMQSKQGDYNLGLEPIERISS